jgi:hypothetical protein
MFCYSVELETSPVSTTALVLVTQFSNSFFRVIPVYYFKLRHKWLLLNPYLITLPETLDFVYTSVFTVAVRHTGLNLYLREQQGVTFCNFCWNVGKRIPRGVSSQAEVTVDFYDALSVTRLYSIDDRATSEWWWWWWWRKDSDTHIHALSGNRTHGLSVQAIKADLTELSFETREVEKTVLNKLRKWKDRQIRVLRWQLKCEKCTEDGVCLRRDISAV